MRLKPGSWNRDYYIHQFVCLPRWHSDTLLSVEMPWAELCPFLRRRRDHHRGACQFYAQ